MEWSDIAVLIGSLVLLYKTFFSKAEKEQQSASINQGEADAIKTYEEAAALNAQLRKTLDQEIGSLRSDLRKAQEDLVVCQRDLRNLKGELAKRDTMIDCLELAYRELARKAIAAGVPAVELNPDCWDQEDDSDEEVVQ